MKKKCLYYCEICNTQYETEEKALLCEAKPIQTPSYEVGDKVRIFSPALTGVIERVDFSTSFQHEHHFPEYHIAVDGGFREYTWRSEKQIELLKGGEG